MEGPASLSYKRAVIPPPPRAHRAEQTREQARQTYEDAHGSASGDPRFHTVAGTQEPFPRCCEAYPSGLFEGFGRPGAAHPVHG